MKILSNLFVRDSLLMALLFAISSLLFGCAGMAPKAQIKLSIEEVEWRSPTRTFNAEAQASLSNWLKKLPLADVRLKLDRKKVDYPELKAFLLQQGLSNQQIELFDSHITLPTDKLFIAGIIINRSIPQCPSWTVPNMADSKVSHSSNFGCAHERNLAIMVADPSDLVRGKKLAPASSEHSINALNRYYRRTIEQAEPEAPAEPLTPPAITGQ
jgi:pilus biogenesis lipoprotein CpaD